MMLRAGFFDLQAAKDHTARRRVEIDQLRLQHIEWRREARQLKRNKPLPRLTWRDMSRIAIPNYLINCQIQKIADRRTPVLDRACLRLERLEERLSGKGDNLSRREALQLSIARWLLQSPNSEHQAILEETPPDPSAAPTSSPASVFDVTDSTRGETDHE